MKYSDHNFTVSVVIVNWNHGNVLPLCLEALLHELDQSQIIVVDNASKDGSVDWLNQNAPGIRLICLEKNQGFSHGFNIGVANSESPWVASINPDVKPYPGFFAELINAAASDETIGICAPKLLRADAPEYLDSTGLFLSRWRRPYDRGQLRLDDGYYDQQTDIFGACGAAALYRREMLDDLAFGGEYFDEDLFAYYEDADLAWRAQKRGWKAIYVPKAVAEHVRGWGDTLRKSRGLAADGPRMALRNRYLMSIKNDAWRYFFADLPGMILREIPRIAYLLIRKPSALLALLDFWQLLPSMLDKRKFVREHQTVADSDIRKWFIKDWNNH